MPNNELCLRLTDVKHKIEFCYADTQKYKFPPLLVAVSKTKPVDMITAAYACGQFRFGENYAQEMASKAAALAELNIEWHFIGPVQSNKTKLIANYAHWVHSIDRVKIAQRLSSQRNETLPALNICLQVNIDSEASKSGFAVNELADAANELSQLPQLKLRGLMCIPKPKSDPAEQRDSFARLRHALEDLQTSHPQLDTLSMGMSDDYCSAIAEGATLVRVGSAIFGARS
jgi:pyridoxal phosphate enzyme (YggS family)